MDDEDIVKETPIADDIYFKNIFVEGAGSSTPVKDLQSNSSDVPENQVEEYSVENKNVEENDGLSVVGNDLTTEFETNMEFESKEAVYQWCREVGRKNNTVVVIATSRTKQEGKGSYFVLRCERGGSYTDHRKKEDRERPNIKKRKRLAGTKKCGCPFRLRSKCIAVDKWNLSVECGTHNHVLPEKLIDGRLKKEEEELVLTLTSSGLRPRQVLEVIKQNNKENHSTMQNIYNARSKLRQYQVEESPMQQLVKFLMERHYVVYDKRDPESDEVTDIFWTHPEASILAQSFPSLLIIDRTYKNNQIKMPFFHAIGMTSTNRYFTVAFAFLEKETEEHYTWALTHLKTIYGLNQLPSVFVIDKEIALVNGINLLFPTAAKIFCPQQSENNIHENCRKSFDDEEMWEKFFSDWRYIHQSQTESEYSNALTKFVSRWAGTHGSSIQYACEEWLSEKESFVCAWTNKIKHYGNISTKNDEYAKLKAWLGVSHHKLVCSWEEMHKTFQDEHIEIKATFKKSLTSIKNDHQIAPFMELHNHVSHEAMDYIMGEMTRMTGEIDVASCRCILRTAYGLPCAHELVQYARESRPIPLSTIDPQWKQLSSISVVVKRVGFDFLHELQLIRQRWIEASEEEQKSLVGKMKELGTPKTRHMFSL